MYVAKPLTPIVVETGSRGRVTLRHLTLGTLKSLGELEKEGRSDVDFMVTALHLHIVDPDITLSEFRGWSRVDLDQIGRVWAADSQGFNQELLGSDVPGAFVAAYRSAPGKWAEGFRTIAKSALEEGFRTIARSALDALTEQRKVFTQQLIELAPGITAFQDHIAELIRPVLKTLDELPAQMRDAHGKLAQHGWYMDPELPFPVLWYLADLIADGRAVDAHDVLVSHFRDHAEAIERRLVAALPHRSRIIAAAFRAHARKEYELSIPVLLTQADGVTVDLFGKQLFTKKAGGLAKHLQALAVDSIEAAFLYPLVTPSPISASFDERGPDFKGLNRHQVLHGEATDYATEDNGLKAISLLNWVAWVGRESTAAMQRS